MSHEYTDNELLEMFRKGNNRNHAFGLIVKKYQERLYWLVRKIVISHDDTDDILQNAFIKAWNGLDNFRAESQLFTWLYRIATNESITFLNQKRRKYFLPIYDVENQLKNTLESDPYFNGNELMLKFQKAILTLPEKQRIVFNMRYFDELSYDQIAEITGTSVGALKASYHHAAKKLEKILGETISE